MAANQDKMNTIPILQGRRILLGVTGSVAAYKAVDLASRLTQFGSLVDVIMTSSAHRFVTPLSFQSVTGRRVYDNLWGEEAHILHVRLVEDADLFVVAPCTAQTMAKLAHGLADDLLTVAALAACCPLMIAPAMDGNMWAQPATKANANTLQERGTMIVGPDQGRMASGLGGMGRLVEPTEILGHIRLAIGAGGSLAGRKCVVTAGGTQESIDPVRFISNHSSGKQGYALAQASLDRGAQVTLITTPVSVPPPVGINQVDVCSAAEMAEAVLIEVADADVLIMAAAVADFSPQAKSEQKISLAPESDLHLTLECTQDILSATAKLRAASGKPHIVVGFAAESENLLDNARSKLRHKQLSLIAANNILASDSGFFVDTNRITLIDANDRVEELPLMSKAQAADLICDRIVNMLDSRGRCQPPELRCPPPEEPSKTC